MKVSITTKENVMENENQNESSTKIVAAVLAAAAVGGVIVMRDKIRGFFSRNKTV